MPPEWLRRDMLLSLVIYNLVTNIVAAALTLMRASMCIRA